MRLRDVRPAQAPDHRLPPLPVRGARVEVDDRVGVVRAEQMELVAELAIPARLSPVGKASDHCEPVGLDGDLYRIVADRLRE